MSQIIIVPFNDQEIGQGFNSESHENVGTGLTMANVSEDPLGGQIVRTSFESISTQESLMESLGISASLDARYGLFSGGAKMDFSEKHAVNSFSSFIAGRCEVHNAVRHGHGFHLTPEAEALITAVNMEGFKTAFGDMFVRSLKTGGEFYIVARITSVSEEHQSKMSASLHAEYNGLAQSGSFKTSFEEAQSETKGRSEVTVFMSQAGGIGGEASFTGSDATKILERLNQFPQSTHDHPVGYEAELATYDTIPIPVPSPEEHEDREIVLADCLSQKTLFLKAMSDLEFVLDPSGAVFFENLPTPDELTKMQSQYRVALNGLMAHAIKVATGKMISPQLFVASQTLPPVHFKKKPQQPVVFVTGEAFAITLDGVLLAGGFRNATDLAGMSLEDKRNTLITVMGALTRIPVPNFFQGFDTDTLVAKAAILVLLIKAGIQSVQTLRSMSDGEQRNTLIVDSAALTQFTIAQLQGMNDFQLVQVGFSWFVK